MKIYLQLNFSSCCCLSPFFTKGGFCRLCLLSLARTLPHVHTGEPARPNSLRLPLRFISLCLHLKSKHKPFITLEEMLTTYCGSRNSWSASTSDVMASYPSVYTPHTREKHPANFESLPKMHINISESEKKNSR